MVQFRVSPLPLPKSPRAPGGVAFVLWNTPSSSPTTNLPQGCKSLPKRIVNPNPPKGLWISNPQKDCESQTPKRIVNPQ